MYGGNVRYTCGHCGRELLSPSVRQCPHCGVFVLGPKGVPSTKPVDRVAFADPKRRNLYVLSIFGSFIVGGALAMFGGLNLTLDQDSVPAIVNWTCVTIASALWCSAIYLIIRGKRRGVFLLRRTRD